MLLALHSTLILFLSIRVALSTVFGVFVACISRGRKLWEVVTFCFFVPSLSLLVWFCIWGAIGMRQARQGMELQALGETQFNNSGYFLADGSDLCYNVPQVDVVVDGETVFTNYLPGVTPVCQFDEDAAGSAAFNILYSFQYPESFGGGGFGPALSVLYLICCALYYVSISDSASFIVDILASNGRKNNHWARRMFWASSAGALTTTVLSSGGGNGLKAVESAVIVGSLPAAFLMCAMFQSITLFCQKADKLNDVDGDVDYLFPEQPEFGMPVYGGVFNIVEYFVSFGKVNPARSKQGTCETSRAQVLEFAKGLFFPFASLHHVLSATYPQSPQTNKLTVAFYSICYLGWTSLWLVSWVHPGLTGVSISLMVLAGLTLGIIRAGFRTRHNIRSNYVADLLAGVFLWPQVFAQMRLYHVLPPIKPKTRTEGMFDGKSVDEDEESI
jgi:BCCT, betaine/carnitine/choline family transporter